MKTLIYGAGPLGCLYTYLLHKAGNDVALLARNEYYSFLRTNGLHLVNEFTKEEVVENINAVDNLKDSDNYDLVIVLMRKNCIKNVLPNLKENNKINNILFMGNNALGFDEYLKYLPKEKLLFGFPGGGGSRENNTVRLIDSEKPNGKRLPIVIGEIDGVIRERTKQIKELFESACIPVNIVDNIDSWLKYHVAFINPIAGALLKSGDNYKLANDSKTIRTYIRSVKEGSRVLKDLGYKKSYNIKLRLINLMPEGVTIKILKQVFNSKFAEVAMMMHVKAAKDEMIELGKEFKILINKTNIKTPNLDELIECISTN